jgi:peptidoglycan/LPS O-acetylase OafA/YrhL
VYLVVLFHAGSGVFSGGYIGVDVFFVLSGFLVTQLLLRDITGRGSIRFGRFYARRFRRLLPAAFVALIVTAIVFAAIASPAEVRNAAGSFKAAFLYVTNFYFIHQSTGYFGANLTANPVLQFWSLAVEEQFYLLWPIALGAGFLFTRRLDRERQLQVLRIAVLVGAIASAVWALSLRNTNPNRAYYGTDARAYELFAGALLALTPAVFARAKRYHRAVHVATVVSLVALIAIATSWVHLDAIERGVFATLITAALLVAIESTGQGLVNRALSNNTVVYLGKVSYGTYLWHWIVILVAVRTFDPSVPATIAIAALVATALAALSYEVLERPVRISTLLDRHRRVVIATGLAISLVSALVFIPKIMNPAHATTPTVQGNTTAGFTPVPAGLDWEAASKGGGPFINCLGKPASACTVVHGTGRRVLLIGDSNAWMMIPAFEEIARRENLTLSVAVHGGCPWQRDLYVYPVTVNGQKLRTEDCRKEKDDLYTRVIPALRPDLIVAMQVSHESPGLTPFLGPKGNALPNGSPAALRWVDHTTRQSVQALRAPGRKLLIIEPIPSAPFDPIACISKAKVLEACRFVASTTPDPVERYYRKLARTDSFVHSADFDRLACPYLPICDPVVNGQIVRRDGSHLAVKFVETLAPAIDTYLKNAGLIPS